jgi:hypothetical protein
MMVSEIIPVGYYTKLAMDVEIGNVLEGYGEVIKVRIENSIIQEDDNGEQRLNDIIVITCPSIRLNHVVEYFFGFYDEVKIMEYVDISLYDDLDHFLEEMFVEDNQ